MTTHHRAQVASVTGDASHLGDHPPDPPMRRSQLPATHPPHARTARAPIAREDTYR